MSNLREAQDDFNNEKETIVNLINLKRLFQKKI